MEQLLLKDLCGRLPYRVKCIVNGLDDCALMPSDIEEEREIKPYLRPMSSMTEEEIRHYKSLIERSAIIGGDYCYRIYDYLDSIHVDYRDLIPNGLALEAPKDMYNNKTE